VPSKILPCHRWSSRNVISALTLFDLRHRIHRGASDHRGFGAGEWTDLARSGLVRPTSAEGLALDPPEPLATAVTARISQPMSPALG
jgi:hypothetical protein